MQPYNERATYVATNSQIAVQVLMSQRNDDIELVPLRPHMVPYMTPAEFAARQLRAVGVVGVVGVATRCAFNEPLPESLVASIAMAFAEYVRVFTDSTEPQTAPVTTSGGDSIIWCERLYALPDTRA